MDKQQGNDSMSAWVTVKEAAAMLGYTEQWTRTLIRRGFIKATKISRDWLINRTDLERFKWERDNPPAQ